MLFPPRRKTGQVPKESVARLWRGGAGCSEDKQKTAYPVRISGFHGASGQNRTDNLLITSEMLCH